MTSVDELLESTISPTYSSGVSLILSPPSHATRTPATANAEASFAMKNADVRREFLLCI
jgi:hypothetical protein